MARFIGISDIHITHAKDPAYRKLLNLMESARAGDLFYLGGDIFDFIVGEQPGQMREYSEFLTVLEKKSGEGVHFLYVEGNHDFHLSHLQKMKNVRVDPESFNVPFEGKRFYLAHGDLVDRDDHGYLFLRSIFRSPFIRAAARVLPEKIVSMIGDKSNQASQSKNPRLPEDRGESHLALIRKKFRTFAASKVGEGADFVVMGHCHDLDQSEVDGNGRTGFYMNVGYPKKHGKYVYWEPGLKSLERRDFS